MSMRDLVPWRRRQGLTRPTSESPFLSIQQEMNRLFDDFFSDSLPVPFQSDEMKQVAVSPKINVEETESEIHVTAELPGMDEKDVDVSLHDGNLVINGDHRANEIHIQWSQSPFDFDRDIAIFALNENTLINGGSETVLIDGSAVTGDLKIQLKGGNDKVTMFNMNRYITDHLLEKLD